MVKQLAGVVLGMAVLGAGAAWAGQRGDNFVVISTASRTLWGSFGSARNSADSVQYIQLAVQAGPSGEVAWVFARDASGVSASCFTSSAALVSTAKAVTSDAYIQATWDTGGQCTNLEVRTTSIHPPKSP